MRQNIIGREQEQDTLFSLQQSSMSEFVAISGRRRIGKTFLVNELFEGQFTFRATGIYGMDKRAQLSSFNAALIEAGLKDKQDAEDWLSAFSNLNALINGLSTDYKKIIFLDEVPWMDTPRSGFLSALEHFWNHWASARHDVLLIICGSAASWMVNRIFTNYGGLYNRLTRRIALEPFTLQECEEYYRSRQIAYTRMQMMECYMVFGGIPYYLSLMSPKLSLYQNIDAMFFEPSAPLRDEYTSMYRSLFKNEDGHLEIIEALASKGKGLTRQELVKATGLSDGGRLTNILDDLVNNGFIRFYQAFNKKQKDGLYQVIDLFSLFNLTFAKRRLSLNENFWMQFTLSPAYRNWSGYAFERVCLLHVPQIKKALGISGVMTEVYAWKSTRVEPGAQIYLVIDRHDGVASLCEMKFSQNRFTIDKAYNRKLRNKRSAFVEETRTRHIPQTVLVTASELVRNEYSNELSAVVTIDDIFAP